MISDTFRRISVVILAVIIVGSCIAQDNNNPAYGSWGADEFNRTPSTIIPISNPAYGSFGDHAENTKNIYVPHTPQPDTGNGALDGSASDHVTDIPVTPKLRIPLPHGYSKHLLPFVSWDTTVMNAGIRLLVNEIVDVDIKAETVKLDVNININWIDYKIKYQILYDQVLRQQLSEAGISYVSLDAGFLKHVWKPDISFQELAEVEQTHFLAEKVGLTLYVGGYAYVGHFQLSTRRTITLRCGMDFSYYPADTQKCIFNIASFNYDNYSMSLSWIERKFKPVYLETPDDPNFDFHISNVEPGNNLQSYQLVASWGSVWSSLTFSLDIRRNLSYHLVQTYLPSVILVLITCLCFLLPVDMVEARIGISMTTLLTLTAMFSSIRDKSPEVSYTMAIDVWMVFCIFLVFLALVLFTSVYWLVRKSALLTESQKNDSLIEKSEDVDTSGIRYFRTIVVASRRYAFGLFALVFSTFLMSYGLWLVLSSGYLNWDPNPLYNNLDGEGGGQFKYVSALKDEIEA